LQARPHGPLVAATAGPHGRASAVGGLGEVEQVGAFGFVKLESAGDRVQDGGGDAAECTAFKLGVILNAHPGQVGDLAATQPRDPATPRLRYPGLLGSDLGTPRDQELADFGAIVHVNEATTAAGWLGCPISTPINSDFLAGCGAAFLEDMTTTFRSVRRWAAAVLATTSLVAVLAGCSTESPTAGINTTAPSPSTVVGPPSSASTGSARIVLRFGDEFATATLSDTPAAREFAAMLPLQLKLHDPMGQAKSGPLPRPIGAAGGNPVFDPAVGEIYYSAPSATFAIFYDDLGQSIPDPGLVRLGTVDTRTDRIAEAGNRFTVQIYLADHVRF
jgi:hypothetical protein